MQAGTHNLMPGQRLARGVVRYLDELGLTSITEFSPQKGLRVDVIALTKSGEVWIIECKSSREDFLSDQKWERYLPFCERFFWAVPNIFPAQILPKGHGLIFADEYGAEMQCDAPKRALASARRKALMLKLARDASRRLRRFEDPSYRA